MKSLPAEALTFCRTCFCWGRTKPPKRQRSNVLTGKEARMEVGCGFVDSELPHLDSTAMHDTVFGSLCFDQLIAPTTIIGKLWTLLGGDVFMRLVGDFERTPAVFFPEANAITGGFLTNFFSFSKTNRQFRSRTDPEASLVRHAGLPSRLRYKSHQAVDDAHEIITAVETTTGAVDEAARLLSLMEAHEDVTGQAAKTVIANARYGNSHNLIACQKGHVQPHLKLLGNPNRRTGRSEGIYSEVRFPYDPLTNTYRCPADQTMKARRLHPQQLTWEYVTAKGTCLVCKLQAFCTRSRSGRTIHRHKDQELLDRARKIANSRPAKRDLKRRQHLIERSFADAANCHGLKRARWRGLMKQAIQDLLIATVQNLRRLVRYLSQIDPVLACRLPQLIHQLFLARLVRTVPILHLPSNGIVAGRALGRSSRVED